MNPAIRRKLVPEDLNRDAAAKSFWRGVADQLVQRAASTVASITNSVIAPVAVAPLLSGLAPSSALFALFARCARIDMTGRHQGIIPRVDSITAPTLFVSEGSPHPVFQAVTKGEVFGPTRKVLVSCVISNEMRDCSPGLALEKSLGEKVQTLVDTLGFDANAADDKRPKGLLNGVSNLGATAGGGLAALIADLAKIAGAFSTAGIAADDLMIFANPAEAIKMRGLLSPAFAANYTIVGTPAIAASQIVAIAPNAILSGFSGEPTIEYNTTAAITTEDTNPLDIVTSGTANTGTVKSLWQLDSVAIRLRMQCC
jgi:hypothetical protein